MENVHWSDSHRLASVLLQEVERGARVEEEDMARLIEQLEGRVSMEVKAPSDYEAIKK